MCTFASLDVSFHLSSLFKAPTLSLVDTSTPSYPHSRRNVLPILVSLVSWWFSGQILLMVKVLKRHVNNRSPLLCPSRVRFDRIS